MTDSRDLIQRLVDALTNAIRVIHNEDGTQHISTAAPVLDEARAYLAQPESDGPATPSPTLMEIVALSEEIEEEGLGEVALVRRALDRWGK